MENIGILVYLSKPSSEKIKIKKKSYQINKTEPREIGNKGSDKGDLNKIIKIK